MTKTHTILALAIASVLFSGALPFNPANADTTVDIDFESLATGSSVEVPGILHPDLDITSPTNGGVVIEEDVLGSYSVPPTNRIAGCLDDADNDGNAKGMGNTAGSAPWTTSNAARGNFEFTFNGNTVNAFSIESYDQGDFRPVGSNPMVMTVTGYDAANQIVDSQTFSVNAHSQYDACHASGNGIHSFSLSGSGIERVEIVQSGGLDPGVGFDNLSFTLEPTNADPVCSESLPSQALLWPPNHKFVPINIDGISDPDGDTITVTIDGITQDEELNAKGQGDGNTSPDGIIDGDTAEVRAERAGTGDGRVYEISFTADDGNGGSCTGSVTVGVPHDKKDTPVDSVIRIDSTG